MREASSSRPLVLVSVKMKLLILVLSSVNALSSLQQTLTLTDSKIFSKYFYRIVTVVTLDKEGAGGSYRGAQGRALFLARYIVPVTQVTLTRC